MQLESPLPENFKTLAIDHPIKEKPELKDHEIPSKKIILSTRKRSVYIQRKVQLDLTQIKAYPKEDRNGSKNVYKKVIQCHANALC